MEHKLQSAVDAYEQLMDVAAGIVVLAEESMSFRAALASIDYDIGVELLTRAQNALDAGRAANALLLEAAPALLAACEALIEPVETYAEALDRETRARKLAKAALARVRGE